MGPFPPPHLRASALFWAGVAPVPAREEWWAHLPKYLGHLPVEKTNVLKQMFTICYGSETGKGGKKQTRSTTLSQNGQRLSDYYVQQMDTAGGGTIAYHCYCGAPLLPNNGLAHVNPTSPPY